MECEMASLRKASGTYVLLLDVASKQKVEVGRLGRMKVKPGTYAYVGSAFGPGGVRARVCRHHREEGATHWHVDYLRPLANLRQVWYTYDPARRECTWAAVLQAFPRARIPIDGFGASDCSCPAHLVFFSTLPSFAAFQRRIKGAVSAHAPIHRIEPSAPGSDEQAER